VTLGISTVALRGPDLWHSPPRSLGCDGLPWERRPPELLAWPASGCRGPAATAGQRSAPERAGWLARSGLEWTAVIGQLRRVCSWCQSAVPQLPFELCEQLSLPLLRTAYASPLLKPVSVKKPMLRGKGKAQEQTLKKGILKEMKLDSVLLVRSRRADMLHAMAVRFV